MCSPNHTSVSSQLYWVAAAAGCPFCACPFFVYILSNAAALQAVVTAVVAAAVLVVLIS